MVAKETRFKTTTITMLGNRESNNDKKQKKTKIANNSNSSNNAPSTTTTIKIPVIGVDVPVPAKVAQHRYVAGNERAIGIATFLVVFLRLKQMRDKAKRGYYSDRVRGEGEGGKGSVGVLEQRGMLDENRDVDEEKFFKGMMKSVRTVEMPELTEAQILVARDRRKKSRAGDRNLEKELKDAKIPANHPFATSEKLDAREEAERKKKIKEANKPRGTANKKK